MTFSKCDPDNGMQAYYIMAAVLVIGGGLIFCCGFYGLFRSCGCSKGGAAAGTAAMWCLCCDGDCID